VGATPALNAQRDSPKWATDILLRWVKAKFYSPTGALEGQFNGTDSLGVFLIDASVVKFRRAPEAAEVSRWSEDAPANAFDTASLLGLSLTVANNEDSRRDCHPWRVRCRRKHPMGIGET
jgi:hypothetical protein